MAQSSGFFEAEWDDELYNEETQSLGDWDRKYLAEEFARYFKYFVSNGVMNDPEDQLKVTAGEGMNISISSGFAFINGFWYYNSEDLIVPVPLNETPSARVDSVRVRWDSTNRKIDVVYVPNDIVNIRNDIYYDLQLAQVTVGASVSSIADANITDTRDNEDLCGLVNIVRSEDIGNLEDLETEDKTNIVASINDVVEIIGGLSGLVTTDKRSIVKAINSIITLIGDLSTLNTYVRTSIVDAINSVQWRYLYGKPFDAVDNSTVKVRTVNGTKYLYAQHTEDEFVLSSRNFVFSNLQCTIQDERITANSLADVYFNSDTISSAKKAKISVETYNGYLVLTAETTPIGTITGMIKVRVV